MCGSGGINQLLDVFYFCHLQKLPDSLGFTRNKNHKMRIVMSIHVVIYIKVELHRCLKQEILLFWQVWQKKCNKKGSPSPTQLTFFTIFLIIGIFMFNTTFTIDQPVLRMTSFS